ncbi:MAG: PBP1A family penicillin-binding protein [Firmicutes bacterium]|nr:PBP1A family penicillin-binding protein [Bacillota bacterium]
MASRPRKRPVTRPLRRRRRPIWQRLLIYLLLLVLLGIVVGGGYLVVLLVQVSKLLPSSEQIANLKPYVGTRILSQDGVVLATLTHERRELAKMSEFPKPLIDAVVAIEDSQFYQHRGISPRALFRAVWVNLREGRYAQGGSTITMQLARNAFLTQKKTFHRKIQEALLALQIEQHLTKEQIMETYLNEVYFGSGAYGAKTAARVYFNKPLHKLTLAECALLAGVIRRPSAYSPHENPELALRRRDRVLERMRMLGFINEQEYQEAKREPIRVVPLRRQGISFKAPYFVFHVLKQLMEDYGEDQIYREGLTVETTLNWQMQQAAEQALREGLAKYGRGSATQGAIIAIDPQTGFIRAMVGGVDFSRSQYNATTQGRRQPGSAFKPIVYCAAIDRGLLTPDSRIVDAPVSYPSYPKPYRPKNADGRYRGSVTVRQAIAYSINIPAVKTIAMVGPQTVIDYARKLGIQSPLEPNLSLALGSSAVRPIEMAVAYGVFASGGNRCEPVAVVRVRDREGDIIQENAPEITYGVIPESTAKTMDDLLKAPVRTPGGTAYRVLHDFPEARGKTGTTDEGRDAWFVGYTPELVTAVWVAREVEDPVKKQKAYLPMPRVFGGTVCAPIWKEFMSRAVPLQKEWLRKLEPGDVPQKPQQPESVDTITLTLCDDTGMIATPACPHTHRFTFRRGEEPAQPCTLHGSPQPSSPDVPDSTASPSSEGEPPATTAPQTPEPVPPPAMTAPGNVSGGEPAMLQPRVSEPPPVTAPVQPRLSEPKVVAPPAEEKVRICADSGLLATRYCPEVVIKSFAASKAPRKRCPLHRPPPGEE